MKIALVGAASSYKQTPWGDPELRIWGLGMHVQRMQRCARVFEMHHPEIWEDYLRQRPAVYAQKLRQADVPIVMRERHPDIPLSEPFPFEAVIERWGSVAEFPGPELYVSSFDYMIAYALLEEPDELRLYGVTMSSAQEYGYQKPSASYWLGLARGMGVRVWIHQQSPLLRTRLPYGSLEWFEAGADTTQKARFKVGMERGLSLAY